MDANTYAQIAQLAATYFDATQRRSVAAENDKTANAIYAARQRVRAAGNLAAAGRADMTRFMQSLNNQYQGNAMERSAAALRATIGAQRDAKAAQTFEGRIAAAGKQGRIAAQAAAAGVTGGSTSLISGTYELQKARQEYALTREQEARDAGIAIQSAGVTESRVMGMDQRTIFAALDHTTESRPTPQAQGGFMEDFLYTLSKSDPKRLASAAEDAYGAVRGLFSHDWGKTSPNEDRRFSNYPAPTEGS